MSSWNKVFFLFPIYMPSVSSFCLSTLAGSFSMMLDGREEVVFTLSLVSREVLSFSVSMMFIVGFFWGRRQMIFIKLKKFLILNLLFFSPLIMSGCCQMLCVSVGMITWFFFFFLLYLLWCSISIDFRMLDHSYIPGASPTWSWHIIYFVCCLILFASRIFFVVLAIELGVWGILGRHTTTELHPQPPLLLNFMTITWVSCGQHTFGPWFYFLFEIHSENHWALVWYI